MTSKIIKEKADWIWLSASKYPKLLCFLAIKRTAWPFINSVAGFRGETRNHFYDDFAKMPLSLFEACFSANLLAWMVHGSQQMIPNHKPSNCGNTIISAIKTLETKLENLIALVNKTSTPTPQPTPPGKLD